MVERRRCIQCIRPVVMPKFFCVRSDTVESFQQGINPFLVYDTRLSLFTALERFFEDPWIAPPVCGRKGLVIGQQFPTQLDNHCESLLIGNRARLLF